MDEYSRILIEQYCSTHNSKKSKHLSELVDMSCNIASELSDDDALFLEKAIRSEKNAELKEAMQDLDEFLFG
jgi:hypothetical protein